MGKPSPPTRRSIGLTLTINPSCVVGCGVVLVVPCVVLFLLCVRVCDLFLFLPAAASGAVAGCSTGGGLNGGTLACAGEEEIEEEGGEEGTEEGSESGAAQVQDIYICIHIYTYV